MQFRKNINALRAVAVISVVLFHFKIRGFGGGFTGVDIFFVISGFLMTGIIFKGLQEQQFSLLSFYASRARRIIPALLVLCIALLIFGFLYLPLDDYRDSIKTIKSALLFSSNFDFAKEGNYFDAPLHENWLLHTWSLSVEWQFYMLYPVLLMLLFKHTGVKVTKVALVLLATASLVASVYMTKIAPVFAFYMLPTRAWEMIAGGLAFLFPLQLGKRACYVFEALGLAAILVGIFYFSEQDFWPGYLALLPVMGAVLVIYGNTHSIFSANKTLQFTGGISYSVYLWHWPIVVFLYICGLLESSAYVLASIFLSFALGALSFYFVESKSKNFASAPKAIFKYAAFLVVAVGVSAIIASLVKKHPDIRFSFLELGQPDYTSKMYKQECYPNEYGAADCKLGTGEISVIIFGDSHAQSTAAAVQMENKEAALEWARGGCPTLKNFEMHNKEFESKCRGFMGEKLATLKDSYHGVPVVLFSRASLYLEPSRENGFQVYFNGDSQQDKLSRDVSYTVEYVSTVCAIAENHPVYIVKPIPEMPFSIYKGLNLHARVFQSKSDITIPLRDYESRNRTANGAIEAAAKQCNARVIDPVPYLCPAGQCMGSKNGVSLYYDDNHLVDAGNEQLRGLFKGIISQPSSMPISLE
ncbi:acyltransferase family protein [Pseudomonas agarici]|uniref:acyltransferase family protein n=1 Tax=Pseudomonas agarici TaxID=46677 RepID=UPI0002DCCF8C|nr:acyltransferase family protein [Pseudomonas agarici]NWB89841.1 acyltransferase [Pseudomonas agarici]NWC07288.1 acyltransferase [Pseudomonas agarici]SEK49354.1 Peptidoglycan/LPS O-acetylase OafA/YrhL, contains acyltransferase and SGNH-hydrolase domains [Pseudomonas agarici]